MKGDVVSDPISDYFFQKFTGAFHEAYRSIGFWGTIIGFVRFCDGNDRRVFPCVCSCR